MSQLKKSIGLPLLIFYGTGMILGAGIYSVIGKAAAQAGETLWLSFVFAAVAAALTALSYAELGTMYSESGAEYTYLKKAFPSAGWLSTSTGLLAAVSGMATAATVSLAFSGYLNTFVEFQPLLAALAVLFVFTGVSLFGIQESSWVNVIFTLIEISGLLIFIYLGLQSDKFGTVLESTRPTMGTLSGAALIIFAYFGFENIVTLAEEAKEPEKTIPRAILISLCISTALYVLTSIAALALMEPAELSESSAVMTEAARRSSPKLASVLGGIALFSTANTALISLISSSRIIYGMAKNQSLPPAFARVSGRKTPWVASLLTLGVAILFTLIGQVEVVASVTSFATMLCFLLINIALIVLRFLKPEERRPFKVPLSPGRWPVLPVCAAGVCLVFLTQFKAQVYTIGFASLAVCILAGWWFSRLSR